jgi:PhnB protein
MKIENYLFFNGNCEQAMKFYEKALGGKIEAMMTYGSTPAAEHVDKGLANKIIHSLLTVGDAVVMASDAHEEGQVAKQGFAVTLGVDTVEEADRLFNALGEGAKVTMPIGETFFSKRFGMLTDKFGVPWMVNCTQPL